MLDLAWDRRVLVQGQVDTDLVVVARYVLAYNLTRVINIVGVKPLVTTIQA